MPSETAIEVRSIQVVRQGHGVSTFVCIPDLLVLVSAMLADGEDLYELQLWLDAEQAKQVDKNPQKGVEP